METPDVNKRQELERLLESFRGFVGSPVHREYIASTRKDLATLEERILDDDLSDIKDIFNLIDQRGQRKVLRAGLTAFEETVVNLENQVQELLDLENEIQHNHNDSNDDEL